MGTGNEWEQVYPRAAVIFPLYDAMEVGHEYYVPTECGHWIGAKHGACDENTLRSIRRTSKSDGFHVCIRTLSCQPRVFGCPDILSKDECRHIIDASRSLMKPSVVTTKATRSKVRTSTNAWLPRWTSPVIDNIFDRLADICRLDRAYLRHDMCAEFLQVVKYIP